MNKLTTVSLLSLGLAACGSLDGSKDNPWNDPTEQVTEPTEYPNPTDPTDPTDPVVKPSTSALANCTIEPLLWSSDAELRATPSHFEFTADGAAILSGSDVFGSGHRAWSAVSGSPIYSSARTQILSASLDQSRVLQRIYEQGTVRLVVAPLGQPESALWETTGDHVMATIDGTGKRVAYVTQVFNANREITAYDLTIVDVDSGQSIHTQRLTQEDVAWWVPYGPANLEFSDDGKHLVMALVDSDWSSDPAQPQIALFSEGDGWTKHMFDVPFTSPDQNNAYNGQIASMSFTPDSAQLEVVSASGNVIVVDTAANTVMDRGTRGAFAANWDTYLPPLPASPTRWTRDGALKFTVSPAGALQVAQGDAILGEFRASEDSDATRFGWNPDVNNPVMAVAISPDENAFAVAFRKGIGVWGCADALPSGQTSLRSVDVTATRGDGPTQVLLDINLTGSPASLVYGFEVREGDNVLGRLSWDTAPVVWTRQEGPTTLVVEARDAFGSVTSTPIRVP